jgi:hypothetical protein
MKIVINREFGGFGLSEDALEEYCERKGINDILLHQIPRDDPILVEVVEEMGSDANDRYSVLKVVEVPDEVNWVIEENDGLEWVAERHRTWS